MALLHVTCLWVVATVFAVLSSGRSIGIPTYGFTTSGGGTYNISRVKSVLVDAGYAGSRDTTGETLIPPSLREFAGTFATDLHDVLGLKVTVSVAVKSQPDSIFLSIKDQPSLKYVNGEASSEGYTFEVTESGIVVYGASSLGVWWATRSLLQQSIISQGAVPLGKASDVPGWKTRGMMLDAARHYYPAEFVKELCAYMGFFKQNTLQLHLSDNINNNVRLYSRERSLSLYARFRLWLDLPEFEGLSKFRNESYSKAEFKDIQSSCVARGVTILPEIEAPGHALPIVQWKPELGLATDLSLLNISHPDTIPTMKAVWGASMDWFDCKTVHIGADEYTGKVADYNRFVNEIASFIHNNGSKAVRIWGTFPPKPDYDNISKNVSIQHWEFFEDNPLHDYIQNNYSVINSDDTFYIVEKWSGGYPQTINITKTFHGNPADGGRWQPNVFDAKNASNNPERSNKYILGAIAPLWNDFGANTSVYSEAYYAWREGIPALADKQWGGDLMEDEFHRVFPVLHASIPGQNLDRAIPSKTSTILHYDNVSWTQETVPEQENNRAFYQGLSPLPLLSERDESENESAIQVRDKSENGYSGTTNCTTTQDGTGNLRIAPDCVLRTPLASKGRNYTLSVKLKLDTAIVTSTSTVSDKTKDVTIISGADSQLMLTPSVTLFASGNYYRVNSTLPQGEWVTLSIKGRGERTFASVSIANTDQKEEEFQAILGIGGESFVWAPIAIEAPIAEVGGNWSGELAELILSSEA